MSEERGRILALAKRIAPASCPILIMGSTGVGKDVLAEDIHRHSSRARGRFISINCAALTATLFESEVFGHIRGAYTGALSDKIGLAELADGGTLFLDEVGELPLESQAKLLRFLAKGSFWPVGGTRERTVDVRVMAATNRDLRSMLGTGFREDLFFRLSVVTLCIPRLHLADVRRIAASLARDTAARYEVKLSMEQIGALSALCASYPWPGGARELRNAIERYLLLYDPKLSIEDNWQALPCLPSQQPRSSPSSSRAPCPAGDLTAHVDDVIFLAVAQEVSDVRELAHRMGLSVQAIYNRLRKFDLQPKQLGRPDTMTEAMSRARGKAQPYLPWLQTILQM
ncbi:sigma-54 factor interaction domain-containing protein [Polyangium sp. 15x6]|uniref:sigma-54 factor interaction domain-containing protein n=1 Tax=Polyangium sp. 15x6 TaxID=3042687 RepID=UPI002499BDFF|nr:sigma-54 factor interaction domain-containing protein [Polyangium sp. 15x6]MDI3291230.1 sigma-54 factor interaction domain-containing protein [Polyangium sp. 15x6]